MKKAIILENVSKKYTLYKAEKERLLDIITMKKLGKPFYALKDVSFTAYHGEVIGFIGINGSGKSTLSNIIAGILPETSGKVTINGETSLIAISAGLKNDLTGRDNIELKLLMLGFSKKEIENLENDIIEFSELGEFIDQPVKSYSSGMKSRLGFAISINVDPDILIIDEALSVGDRAFAEKSYNKMMEFKEEGKTMIFVSHSLNQMENFCDKILWLEYGRVKAYGEVKSVIAKYREFLSMWRMLSPKERKSYKEIAINGNLNYEAYLREFYKKNSNMFQEKYVSKLGRIKTKKAKIFKSPINQNDFIEATNYLDYTYFIKREFSLYHEKYFLLSKSPSSVNGVLGWVDSKYLKTHNHLLIDQDEEQFYITGKGRALDRPWGTSKNILYKSLEKYKGMVFNVRRTDRVKGTIWHYGYLDGQNVWIRDIFLSKGQVED